MKHSMCLKKQYSAEFWRSEEFTSFYRKDPVINVEGLSTDQRVNFAFHPICTVNEIGSMATKTKLTPSEAQEISLDKNTKTNGVRVTKGGSS